MAEPTRTHELREAERRLQAAQLAGDIAALDQLLDDRLIFTFGPDGECYTKQDDLQLHRSRQQVLTKVIEEDLTVLVEGRTGVTWFLDVLSVWRGSTTATWHVDVTSRCSTLPMAAVSRLRWWL
jgi:Domain of unknown function (DUF4440)